LRSRIRTSSATIDVTSAATAPFESNVGDELANGAKIGIDRARDRGGESFDSVIARRNLRLSRSLSSVGLAILDNSSMRAPR